MFFKAPISSKVTSGIVLNPSHLIIGLIWGIDSIISYCFSISSYFYSINHSTLLSPADNSRFCISDPTNPGIIWLIVRVSISDYLWIFYNFISKIAFLYNSVGIPKLTTFSNLPSLINSDGKFLTYSIIAIIIIWLSLISSKISNNYYMLLLFYAFSKLNTLNI